MENKIKKTFLTGAIMTSMLFTFSACNNGNNSKNETDSKDPKDIADVHNDAKFNDDKEKDAKFMVDAAELNLEEIKLGELAQKQATNADVKDLAKMMVDEHSKAMKELQALAATKQITIPSEVSKDVTNDYNALADKHDGDFDRAYSQKMVDGHENAIKKFETASSDATDFEIKNWASKMLPSLRTHLDHAMMCRDRMKAADDKAHPTKRNNVVPAK